VGPHDGLRRLDVRAAVLRHRSVGILVDTFVVRTITVPAIAVLLGRASRLARLWERRPEQEPPRKRTVFDAVADA
jgi:putative drug exporter of the RND superfamily